MRLHRRSDAVIAARSEISEFVTRVASERGLTPVELNHILVATLGDWSLWSLRHERHNEDVCEAKADERCDRPECNPEGDES